MESLRRVMEGVADYNGLRQQLTADMADSSQRREKLATVSRVLVRCRVTFHSVHSVQSRVCGCGASHYGSYRPLDAGVPCYLSSCRGPELVTQQNERVEPCTINRCTPQPTDLVIHRVCRRR